MNEKYFNMLLTFAFKLENILHLKIEELYYYYNKRSSKLGYSKPFMIQIRVDGEYIKYEYKDLIELIGFIPLYYAKHKNKGIVCINTDDNALKIPSEKLIKLHEIEFEFYMNETVHHVDEVEVIETLKKFGIECNDGKIWGHNIEFNSQNAENSIIPFVRKFGEITSIGIFSKINGICYNNIEEHIAIIVKCDECDNYFIQDYIMENRCVYCN
jgi:hypothetical protein